MTEYTINAAGKSLGRVASETAKVLMGKHRADYTPNNPPMTKVIVENVEQLAVTEKRLKGQTYQFYSGYPGGQKTVTLAHLASKKGMAEGMRLAVQRMLPNNKLRPKRMKNLTIR